jgi:uncharacterized protein involved in exopolysaccharide biosynthesis
MTKEPSREVMLDLEPGTGSGERVTLVVARDVLSPDRRRSDRDEFLTTLWKGRWVILWFVLGFALFGLAYGFLATKWYRAEVVLTPAPQKTNQALAGLAGSGTGGLLAGLVGLNLGNANTDEAIGVLKSRDFARQFIEDQGLLHVLLADKWDARAGRWKETDPERQPDIRDAVRYFGKRVLSVDQDKRTGLITVAVEWKNAATAAAWANMIVDRLNNEMRTRALADGEANVAYLRRELGTTNEVAVQGAISRLLETELQRVMVARGDRQFSFRIVDPAEVPKYRSWPKRSIILAVAILAGGLAGVAAVFARQSFGRARTTA